MLRICRGWPNLCRWNNSLHLSSLQVPEGKQPLFCIPLLLGIHIQEMLVVHCQTLNQLHALKHPIASFTDPENMSFLVISQDPHCWTTVQLVAMVFCGKNISVHALLEYFFMMQAVFIETKSKYDVNLTHFRWKYTSIGHCRILISVSEKLHCRNACSGNFIGQLIAC